MFSRLKKKIKSYLYDLFINYRYKKIIRDSKLIAYPIKPDSKHLESLLSKLNQDGIIEIKNYDLSDNINNFNENNFLKNQSTNLFENSPVYIEPKVFTKDSIVEKIINDNDILFLIKSYLGADALLDMISLSVTEFKSDKEIISEKWHYDNVGKRLKLFLYLNSNDKISTDYILTTNKLTHNNFSMTGSRIKNEKAKKLEKKIKNFFPTQGSLILFDTNGIHRGNYSQLNKSITKSKFRIMLKFEFSSKNKSEKFYGKNENIGPRSTFFSEDFNFGNFKLIDKEYLTKIKNFYFYDKSYTLNRWYKFNLN